VLYCVSLALSYIRIRTHSVACSTLVHMTYNLTIFAIIYISTGGFHHLDQFLK
jgi:membrane protease YdiL (CAAX protease family)